MNKTYRSNLQEDVRRLLDGLSITKVYGEITPAERQSIERLEASLERFYDFGLAEEEEEDGR